MVFIDETWAKTNMTRTHGWATRGEALIDKVPHGHWKTLTFIAGLRHDGIVAPCVLDGPINGETFTAWVEQFLIPALEPGSIVVLDNLGSHKGSRVRKLLRAAGIKLLFLPPYSPDLNPIEAMFSKLKRLLRKANERSVEATWRRIGKLLDQFPPSECANYRDLCAGSTGRQFCVDFWLGLNGRRVVLGLIAISSPRPFNRALLSDLLHNIQRSFEIVGDCGEVDLNGGFGDATPSHSAQTIASFPCPKYLFDAPPYPVDWLVPVLELLQRRLFVAPPHASGDDAWYSALCNNSITEMASAIGAVRKYLAGITGQCIGASSAVVDIGGRDCNFFDQRCVSIGPDMCLEAVHGRLTLVFNPTRIIIALACRRNYRGIHQRPGLDCDRFGLELSRHGREQQPVKLVSDQGLAKADKRCPLGCGFRS